MKNILLSFSLLMNFLVFSQVGIGTTSPDASSMLDIRSANSGLLIPRVSLTSTTDITTIARPATSLLVYNTSSVSDVTPGFFYWDSVWKSLKGTTSSSISEGWSLSGNTLVSGNEFIGTNDYNSLVFKVNGNLVSKFHPNGGIAVGLNSRATGQQATAIGTETNSSAQNATAIGYQATAIQPNSIVLGSSTNSNNKVGIGTNTPDERVHINGSIKIVDGTEGFGKVLTSDANGRASWTTPSRISSFANIYSANNQTRNYNQNVTFGSTNASLNINVNNDNLEVNTTGSYKITYTVTFYRNNKDDAFRFGLFTTTNNNSFISGSLTSTGVLEENDRDERALSITNSVIVTLNAFDKVYLRCLSADSNNNGHKINLLGNACSLIIEQLN